MKFKQYNEYLVNTVDTDGLVLKSYTLLDELQSKIN